MRQNDEKVAAQIAERFIHARVVCDDGNVHANFPEGHDNDAESCVEAFGHKRVSDGVQEGEVCVWVGKERVNE